jgi:DNA-directed RNA polymerase II subunit RPB1
MKNILSLDLFESTTGDVTLDVVDRRRTTTNNNHEVYQILGIEAARQSLLREIRGVLDVYGIYVNYRHLATLCDIMTTRGSLNSLGRHGINRVIDGPFRRASFEETVEILFEAGIFNKEQKVI